jgi:hypothetical protein
MPLTITFDANTLDKVSRSGLFLKDLNHAEMVEIDDVGLLPNGRTVAALRRITATVKISFARLMPAKSRASAAIQQFSTR